MHNLTLYRVGQIGDQAAGHTGSHCIAVLHAKSTEEKIDEFYDMGSDPFVDSANEAMQDEESTVHDLTKLLEDVNCQIYEQGQHLIIDAFVPHAHQTWLQRAA